MENKILELAERMRQLTSGICRVGIGPYGFGVRNDRVSPMGLLVHLSPNPYGDEPLDPNVKEISVSVSSFLWTEDKRTVPIETEEAVRMQEESSDPVTRLVASALRELEKAPFAVTIDECDDAFSVLAEKEMNWIDMDLTEKELEEIRSLRWWENRSPDEIVSVQLYGKAEYMPFQQFHDALESVLGRTVSADEFSDMEKLRNEHRDLVMYGRHIEAEQGEQWTQTMQ